ncbi:MAG: protein kinase [Actinoplanes sp.]
MTGEWAVGDVVFDHYEVRDVIHLGGMGVIYRVHHREWETEFAVKTPRPELARTANGRAAFEQEAETWVRLGMHPHIVTCAHVRRLDGVPRAFAEWVDGGNLGDAVAAGRLADPVAMVDTAVQIAWGLAYAHGRGLVHQDVKPANVMLEPDGTAKVTDFGLARADAGFAGRTPAYCSPEQARAAAGALERVTAATDVWSWALCVLEMATGGRPTRFGQAGAEVFENAAAGLGLPPGVVSLLRRCFRADPAQRPGMGEVAEELVEAYAALTGSPYPRRHAPETRLLADALSNQALSLLELGDVEGAEEAWRTAAELEPGHVHTVYNRGLHLWRTGRLSDEQLVSDLTPAAADPLGRRLLDQVLAERGTVTTRTLLKGASLGGKYTHTAVDHEGRVALTGDFDGRLTVWSPADGRTLHRLSGAGSRMLNRLGVSRHRPVRSVAVDRAGRIGLAARDGGVEVWDLTTGTRRAVLGKDPGVWVFVAISGDGRTGLVGARHAAAEVWDLSTGALTGRLVSPEGSVLEFALSDDGRHALTLGNQRLRSWDVQAETTLWHRATRDWQGVVMSRDARFAALVDREGDLVVWDALTGQVRHEGRMAMKLGGGLHGLSPDGALLLAGEPARFWATESGRSLHTPDGYTFAVPAVSGDGRLALLLGDETQAYGVSGSIRAPWSYVRPRDTGQLVTHAADFDAAIDRADRLAADGDFAAATRELWVARGIPGFAAHPSLRHMANALGRHGLRAGLLGVWPSWEETSPDALILPVAITQDGDCVFAVDGDGRLRAWENGQLMAVYGERMGRPRTVGLDPAEEHVASVTDDGVARVWDLFSGQCHATITGVNGPAVAHTLTNDHLVVGDLYGAIQIWDLTTGVPVTTIPARPELRLSDQYDVLAVSPDGEYLMAAGDTARLFRFATGELLGERPAAGEAKIRFSPDGREMMIATGQWAELLEIPSMRLRYRLDLDPWGPFAVGADWRLALAGTAIVDVASGRVRQRLPDLGRTQAAAVTADSRFAATGSADRRVRIWDLTSGDLLRTLSGHRGVLWDLRWSTDATTLITCDLSPAVHAWRCDWDYQF